MSIDMFLFLLLLWILADDLTIESAVIILLVFLDHTSRVVNRAVPFFVKRVIIFKDILTIFILLNISIFTVTTV